MFELDRVRGGLGGQGRGGGSVKRRVGGEGERGNTTGKKNKRVVFKGATSTSQEM